MEIKIAEDVLFEIFGFLAEFRLTFGNVRLVNKRYARIGLSFLPNHEEEAHVVDRLWIYWDKVSQSTRIRTMKPEFRWVEIPLPDPDMGLPSFITGFKHLRVEGKIGDAAINFFRLIKPLIDDYAISFMNPDKFMALENHSEFLGLLENPSIVWLNTMFLDITTVPNDESWSELFRNPTFLGYKKLSIHCRLNFSIGKDLGKEIANWFCHANGQVKQLRITGLDLSVDSLVNEIKLRFKEQEALSAYDLQIFMDPEHLENEFHRVLKDTAFQHFEKNQPPTEIEICDYEGFEGIGFKRPF